MFAGFEGIEYFVDQNEADDEELQLPQEYLPPKSSADPWFKNSLSSEDFILIAEGSELEGPIPLVSSKHPIVYSFNFSLCFSNF